MLITFLMLLTYQGMPMETNARTPDITFDLSMPRAAQHYFDITMTVRNSSKEYVDIVLPVWTPGSYKIRDFSRNIETLRAQTSDGQSIPAEKISKNVWRIQTGKARDFQVIYDYYAFELTVRTSYLDDEHGFVNGANLFFYIDGQKPAPVTLNVHLPSSWKKVTTALKAVPGKAFSFTAKDYDELADSPIEIGNHEVLTFEALGVPHEIAVFGFGSFDERRLIADMTKVIGKAAEIFGDVPHDRYAFIIHMLPGQGGGLEHMNSTTLGVDSWFYQDADKYISFLTLVAHEYFHLWNVKRLRPEGLGPFDYTREVYTELLWVAEGFTSYYDEQIVLRAGLMTEDKYIERLESVLRSYLRTPGRLAQPLTESSFDAWIKFYVTDENSGNSTVSYYTKGGLVALQLDLEILQRTQGQRRLDDLLRWLWTNTYKKGRGYTMDDIQKGCRAVAGGEWKTFFDSTAYSALELPLDKYFGMAGYELKSQPASDLTMGIDLKTGENAVVRSVVRGLPAYTAGISADDEIVAIDNVRVTSSSFNRRIQNYRPGETVTLLVSRNDRMREMECLIARDTAYKLERLGQPDERQLKIQSVWLAGENQN